jgi:hypothetical protein
MALAREVKFTQPESFRGPTRLGANAEKPRKAEWDMVMLHSALLTGCPCKIGSICIATSAPK